MATATLSLGCNLTPPVLTAVVLEQPADSTRWRRGASLSGTVYLQAPAVASHLELRLASRRDQLYGFSIKTPIDPHPNAHLHHFALRVPNWPAAGDYEVGFSVRDEDGDSGAAIRTTISLE